MRKRIERTLKEKDLLAQRVERDLAVLRRAGRVSDLHPSYIASLSRALTVTLPDGYDFGELELQACELVSQSEVLRSPMPGSAEDIAEQAEHRAANPSKAMLAKLSPSDRLAFANKKKLEELEADAARANKIEDRPSASKSMTAAARLREANSFREKAAREVQKAAPVVTPESETVADNIQHLTPAQQIGMQDVWRRLGIDLYSAPPRKQSAGQRLAAANVAAYEAAKKAKAK